MKNIKDLKGYENIKEGYYVDKDGNVYSFRNNHGEITKTPKKLKQYEKTDTDKKSFTRFTYYARNFSIYNNSECKCIHSIFTV